MFDNICSLPLSADVFAQALHPTLPILSVGLSSGHVHTFRLPSLTNSSNDTFTSSYTTSPTANAQLQHDLSASVTSTVKTKRSPQSKPLTPPSVLARRTQGRRNSENGLDVVDTLWRTRRHKGSCRALSFSHDGSTLFSAGSDGIVKAADAETGRVVGKVAVPNRERNGSAQPDPVAVLTALSPVNIVLGTDEGAVLVYDLRQGGSSSSSSSWTPKTRAAQSLRPHRTEEDPLFAEAITSITPLPPTTASTSGTSRSWISTAGSTVACVDLRKGVVGVSEDQGDVLLSSACIDGGTAGEGYKRKVGGVNGAGGFEKLLVGGAGGVVTVWERGQWADQVGRVMVQKDDGGFSTEGTVDSMCALPPGVKVNGREAGRGVMATGLGSGLIKFVRLRGRGGEVIGSVGHDELKYEGVTTLGFDVEGRMVSGGGSIVKIWKERAASETIDEYQDEEDVGEIMQMGDGSDDEGASDDSEEEKSTKRKKRRKVHVSNGRHFGDHGVMAIPGLD